MTDRSEPGDAPALIYLEQAEDVLHSHAHASLITDEAALLRGCLFALVAIGRHLVDHTPEPPAPHPYAPQPPYSSGRYLGVCDVCGLPRSAGPHHDTNGAPLQ